MDETKKIMKRQILPVLPLRGITVFPHMTVHFDVGRSKSVRAISEAMRNHQLVFLVTQIDATNENPDENGVYKVGTIAMIRQILRLPGDAIRVLVEGISRAEIADFTQTEPYFEAEVCEKVYIYDKQNKSEAKALIRKTLSVFEEYVNLNQKMNPDLYSKVLEIQEISQISDVIAANLTIPAEDKQLILSEFDSKARLEKLISCLSKEIEILNLEKDISMKVKQQMDKMQKEYYLKEQMKAIQNELGDKDGIAGEIAEYRAKFKELELPEEVFNKTEKELDRLQKMQSGSAEGAVIRNYLDCIADLPWNKKTEDFIDLKEKSLSGNAKLIFECEWNVTA
jgi:ATP-dependent Lon protease